MALAPVIDTLESVPEAVRGAYLAKDGKFHLDFEIEDTTGLKNTVTATRAERDAALAEAKTWKQFGKTPAEIAEMVEAARAKEEAAEIKAGGIEKVLAKRLGDQKLEYDGKISAAEKQRESALNIAKTAVVNTSLATALTKAKASAEGLKALPTLIGNRVKIEFDDNGNASSSILDADGKPMVGSLPNGLANYDDLVKEAIKEYPSLFEGAGGGSGANQGQRRDAGGKTLTRAEFDTLDATAKMERMKTGWKVID